MTMNTNLRIWRSPESAFGVFRDFEHENEFQYESYTAETAYSDQELSAIASCGFNAIWVHGRLDHLVSHPDFLEFGRHGLEHCERLNRLIERAAKYRIRVVLYLQPPRAVYCADTAFWAAHEEVGGEVCDIMDGRGATFAMRSLCTSHPKVRNYLRDAFAALIDALPKLGALMVISASEYPAHCYSRRNCRPDEEREFDRTQEQVTCHCPACSRRKPEDVIVDLLHDIRDGVRRSSATLPILFWNWCWSMYLVPAEAAIVERMPADTILLCDFERGGTMTTPNGKTRIIMEYSLAYPGPSETFVRLFEQARQRGIEVMPKLQIGTTHELASVVSLPLAVSLWRKADYMRHHQLTGFLGCWNFGSYRSLNPELFNWFLQSELPEEERASLLLAAKRFWRDGKAEEIVQGWYGFFDAMKYYPFSVHFLYYSSLNYTLGHWVELGPLHLGPAGRSWLPDQRGDDPALSLYGQELETVLSDLRQLSGRWNEAEQVFAAGVNDATHPEVVNAALIGCIWESAVNYYALYQLKLTWDAEKDMDKYREICRREYRVVREALALLPLDARQGFHVEAHCYLFDQEKLFSKLEMLKQYI